MTDTNQTEVQDPGFKIDLVINDVAEVYMFFNRPFPADISWLEFDMNAGNLDIVMEGGDRRNFGAKVPEKFARHIQNAFQVMMVQVDEETGKPIAGDYFPLFIHKN